MSNTPDQLTDEAIAQFLRRRSADPDLGLLDDIVRTVRATPQDRPWLGLQPILLPRRTLLIVAIALLLATMGAIGVGSMLLRPDGPVAPLPTTPEAWERVLIETPQGIGTIASLAAGPHGLLAVVQGGDRPEGGDGPTRLVASTDGRNWTLVPEGQHPSLSDTNGFGLPSVVGTDRGFLLLQLNEVWMSENGYDWRRLASPATGGPDAATVGGPGLVGVGSDRAWYSVDGSDWSLAAVPALPAEILARPDSALYVAMTGVTAAGDDLVAWGIAEVPLADNNDEHLVVPLLWASRDGRTWSSVALPEMDSITAVTGGPGGFVAAGQTGNEAAVWLSADGESWERVAGGAFTSHRSGDSGGTLKLESAASTSAGYVVVGGDGLCLFDPCPDEDAVIWTSSHGRSWFAVASDDRFARASAREAISWGSRFVVGGFHDGKPAIWISGAPPSSTASPTPSPVALPADGAVVEPGWYSVTVDGYRYTFRVPNAGWKANVVTPAEAQNDQNIRPNRADVELTQGGASNDPPDLAGFGLWGIVPYVHEVDPPCSQDFGFSEYGPGTADDLATAIASIEGWRSSEPTDITVGGYSGKRLQLTAPGRDKFDSCAEGDVQSFSDENEKARAYEGPDQVDDIWILDLESGDRHLFLITYFPTTPADRVDQLRQMIESLEIEPVGTTREPSASGAAGAQPAAFDGSWEATDADGSHQTVEVTALGDGTYDLTILDDRAQVCSGTSSTMTGVAEVQGPGTLVIGQPEYTCDDGSRAEALSGPPLEEQLRDLSFSYDSLRDALFDSVGLEWTRMEVAP